MKLHCFKCGKVVSSEIEETVIIRGTIECPECAEEQKETTKPKSIKERIKKEAIHFIDVAEGKYSIYQDKLGSLKALRYGEPWRNLPGDNLIYNMMIELIDAKEKLKNEEEPPSITFGQLMEARKIINRIKINLKESQCSKEYLLKIINGDIQ